MGQDGVRFFEWGEGMKQNAEGSSPELRAARTLLPSHKHNAIISSNTDLQRSPESSRPLPKGVEAVFRSHASQKNVLCALLTA